MRAREVNEISKTDPKESKHGEDLYQNAGADDSRYVIDSKAGRSLGEPQGHTGLFGSRQAAIADFT